MVFLDVIKNNFHTIDLDPSLRISDETENILLKSEIINEVFEDYYENENEGFKKLVEAYSGSRDDEKLKDMILNLYRFNDGINVDGINVDGINVDGINVDGINSIPTKWVEPLAL